MIVFQLLNCWVHARCAFSDSVKATKSKHAAQAILLFKKVFDAENDLRKQYDEGKITKEVFLQKRKENVKPQIENLHAWLVERKKVESILDSSKTKQAVNYCLNRFHKKYKTAFLNILSYF